MKYWKIWGATLILGSAAMVPMVLMNSAAVDAAQAMARSTNQAMMQPTAQGIVQSTAQGMVQSTAQAKAQPPANYNGSIERGFLSSTDKAILYMDTTEFYFTEDNEQLKFVNLKNGTLKLMSADGKKDIMSFINYDGARGGVAFVIRPVYAVLPKGTFYEIIADVGAHGKNCGYWLIGKRNGQWVTYVSLDSSATMGYTPDRWHRIRTETNGDATGRFILTSEHEYMPTGAKYGYESKVATDLTLQLYWDREAQWFGMRRL